MAIKNKEFIKEYIKLFKEKNSSMEKYGSPADVEPRLNRLLKDNEGLTLEEIFEATKLYLYETDYRYIRKPHFFIRKGVGVNTVQDILGWIEKYRMLRDYKDKNRIDSINTMQ